MGFLELIVIATVGLIVMGPEKLPGAIRTVVQLSHKIRRTLDGLRYELEREVGADEIRHQLKNNELTKSIDDIRDSLDKAQLEAQREAEQLEQALNRDIDTLNKPHEPPSN